MSSSISPSWRASDPLLSDAQRASTKSGMSAGIPVNSPLLFEWFGNIDAEEKHVILDIAQANNESLAFLSDYRCKLYLNNGINEVRDLTPPEDENLTREAMAATWQAEMFRLMGLDKTDKNEIDMIMLWSLINYLSEDQAKALIQVLLPYCRREACLHMYIFTSETMAAKPANYRIARERKVMVQPQQSGQKISCPGYNLKQLQAILSPFNLEHSMMLSSGIHEYLFQLP